MVRVEIGARGAHGMRSVQTDANGCDAATPRRRTGGILGVALLSMAVLFGSGTPAHAVSYTFANAASTAIPDTGSCASVATHSFNVTDLFTIDDLDVGIVIDHATKKHLRATVTSPQGTSVEVISTDNGPSRNDYNVRLSDEAGVALARVDHDSTASYPQFVRVPSNALSAFDGEEAAGTWTVDVCDTAPGAAGTFQQSHLEFTGTPFFPLEVTSTADTNTLGTLRYAITYANANPADDAITFNIPGGGPHTITLTSNLPDLNDDGISIDGSTQPGATCGTTLNGNGVVTDRDLRIALDRNSTASGSYNARVTASSVTLRGLAFLSGSDALFISNGTGFVGTCLHVGVGVDGLSAKGSAKGIRIQDQVSTTIGGTAPGDRVIAAGATSSNIFSREFANGLTIINTWVGIGADGLTTYSGTEHGIDFEANVANFSIGDGTTAGQVISAGHSLNNFLTEGGNGTIRGSVFGLRADGSASPITASDNIFIEDRTGLPASVVIGGIGAGDGNIIASGGKGIVVIDTSTAAIIGNTISGHTALGIDLGDDGVTGNDGVDGDSGPNDLLNFPLIDTISADGSTTVSYDFDLDAPAPSSGIYRIDFFKNSAPDTTNGEGQVFLGYQNVTHGGGTVNHTGSFTASTTVSAGESITTTTTRVVSGTTYDITSEFSVNVAATVPPDPLIVTSTADTDTLGTLRYAINHANANTGDDAITFNIAGAGVQTIALTSELPEITDAGVSIDGSTQPGATCGASVNGVGALTDRTLLIEIDGTGGADDALTVAAANVTIKGLSIGGAVDDGLFGTAASDNLTLLCNHIGLEADGTTVRANTVDGVHVTDSDNLIAGDGTYAGRNVIMGNSGTGLGLYIFSSTSASVRGNYIGVDATGMAAPSLPSWALYLQTSSNAVVGGNTAPERNILVGLQRGVVAQTSSSDIVVTGNYHGVGADGTTTMGTGTFNFFNTPNVTFGGTGAGEGNVVSWAGQARFIVNTSGGMFGNKFGVGPDGTTALNAGYIDFGDDFQPATDIMVGDGTAAGANIFRNGAYLRVRNAASRVAILANSNTGGAGLAIDLVGGTEDANGVTANDGGDGDSGPNDLLNYPVINSVTGESTTTLAYDFNLDVPSHGNGYRIDFFKSTAADASGYGEGEIHLGAQDVTHAGGNLNFTGSFTANASIAPGDIISATATRKTSGVTYDITSEFSLSVAAIAPPDPLIVTSTADTNTLGTLRYAILHANANPGDDAITFNIAGGGVHIISPTSKLPEITDDGISIDGETQPGATCGAATDANGVVSDRDLRIVLDGSGLSGTESGLHPNESVGVSLRGLSIINFPQYGVEVDRSNNLSFTCLHVGLGADGSTPGGNGGRGLDVWASHNAQIGDGTASGLNVIGSNGGRGIWAYNHNDLTIQGNHFGTDLAGTASRPNTNTEVFVQSTAVSLTVGGPGAARNVVSGTVSLSNGNSTTVQGNHIGVDASGETGFGIASLSVISFSGPVQIGGTGAGEGNVIASTGSGSGALFIGTNTDSVTVEGNRIGVSPLGTTLSARLYGIWVFASTPSTMIIGGTGVGAGNIIAGALWDGIYVDNSTEVAILGNSIYGNGELAINIEGGTEDANGVTANDSGDGDTGPNDLLNYPVINSVIGESTTTLAYDFNLDVPSHGNGYRIDFFKSTAADASGYGEGEIHLGAQDVAHAGGDLNFTGSFTANASIAPGDIISATATRKTSGVTYDITSEFSLSVAAIAPPDPLIVTSTADTDTLGTLRYAINHANANTGDDAITFNIAGAGPHTITLTTALPQITDDGISIDGTTQSGASCGDLWAGAGHTLMVRLDGPSGFYGLDVRADDVTIKGLSVTGFDIGLYALNSDNTILQCSYMGLAPDGSAAGATNGIDARAMIVDATTNTTLGGPAGTDGNVIGASTGHGVVFSNGTTGVSIQNNFIGTDPTGMAARANTLDGLLFWTGVITVSELSNNIISGNARDGIITFGGVNLGGVSGDMLVQGNHIGVDRTGNTALPNGGHGWHGHSGTTADGITFGGTGTGDRNVISGNGTNGIYLNGPSDITILGNAIGLGVDGSTALGNGSSGINANAVTGLTIGNGVASGRNLIGSNAIDGIRLTGTLTTLDINGNYIGVASDGATLRGNGTSFSHNGIHFVNNTSVVSDGAQIRNNVITGNDGTEIAAFDAVTNLAITGNMVGMDATGATILSENRSIYGEFTTGWTLTDNIIGSIFDSGVLLNDGTATLLGNTIETGINGNSALSVSGGGPYTIGGTGVGEGNIIEGGAGGFSTVLVKGGASATIVGNTIRDSGQDGILTFNSGSSAVIHSNTITNSGRGDGSSAGVSVNSGTNAAIYANSISGSNGLGIDISGGTEDGNGVTANDSGDGDTGPNDLLNYPVINSFTGDGTTAVSFDINLDVPSNANGYRIDFFKNIAADASGHGEGEIHLGSVDVTHTGGNLQFVSSFTANASVTSGDIISATATRKTSGVTYDITSEFSTNVAATPAADPLIVTSTADTDTPGTLRYAINHANTNPADDAITFDITGAGPHTIAPGSTLPIITDVGISIDGTTQSGAVCGQLTTGTPHTLKIHLDLTGAGVSTKAFETGVADVTIKGLSITNAFSHAIQVNAGGDNFVLDCTYIGVEPDGVTKGANARNDSSNPAIRLTGSSNATVRNSLISGNDDDNSDYGLRFENITGGTIEGNIVGLNAAGTAVLGNGDEGILLDGTTSGITIGGTTAATRNVVAGNGRDGVSLISVSTITLLGNYIGLGVDGVTALGNGVNGISANGVTTLAIGNGGASGRNIISANVKDGIELSGTIDGVVIDGNTIGLGADGSTARGNGAGLDGSGIDFNAATSDGEIIRNNIISDNGVGVTSFNGSVTNVLFIGNYVGTDATGLLARGNEFYAINPDTGADGWIFGTPASGNVVSATRNSGSAFEIYAGGHTFQNNLIGVGADGTTPLGNEGWGIRLQSTGSHVVGGTGANEGNIIAHTGAFYASLLVQGGGSAIVSGNTIRDGLGYAGVDLSISGTTLTFHDNTITGEAGAGIQVNNGTQLIAYNNTITDNGEYGVLVSGTTATAALYANSISGNGDLGIEIAPLGVNANDSGDGDTGPNDLLNYPVINSITGDGTTAVGFDINLDVPSHANGYRIDFFKNIAADASGHGEGEIHLGSVDVAHAGGNLQFVASFTANASVTAGDIISATATRKTSGVTYDITSEFSANVTAISAASPLIVTSTADTNTLGTLRYALSNVGAGETISFNIAGGGVHTITPATALPNITANNVGIDGSTQPGATCGTTTNATGGITDRDLRIVIDGSSLASGDGLKFSFGNGASVKGMVFGGAPQHGLNLDLGGGTATVLCSHFGVNAAGTAAFGNGANGLRFSGADDGIAGDGTLAGANVFSGNAGSGLNFRDSFGDGSIRRNFIGVGIDGVSDIPNTSSGLSLVDSGYGTPVQVGDTTGGGNIISGNTGQGVFITNGLWEFYGNYIGTDGAGLSAVPNGVNGIQGPGESLTIGNGTTGGRNIIAGNTGDGLYLRHATTTATVIDGNLIGVAANGAALGNTGAGVNFYSFTGADGAFVRNNTIAHNGNDGVMVVSGATDKVAIYANSIHSNTGLGIDLGGGTEDGNGVTANDTGDGDAGANDLLNYPAINQFTASGSTSVSYDITLDLPVSGNGYRIEFFSTASPDATNGEGQTYLGFVDHAGSGTYTGSFTALASVGVGESISATTTRKTATGFDITSEFSVNATSFTANPAQLAASKSVAVVDDGLVGGDDTVAIPGSTLRYTITIRNDGAGSADSGTTVVVDRMPANGALKLDDFNGAPGVGPLGVTQGSPSSGLTYNYLTLGSGTDDLEFSNDDGATWTYIPADSGDGTDPSVTHIRVQPDGAFYPNSGSAPSIDIRYDVVLF